MKEEQICSRKFITLAGTYCLGILLIMSGFTGLVLADSYAKFQYFIDNPEEAYEVSNKNVFIWVDVLPNYEDIEDFHLIY